MFAYATQTPVSALNDAMNKVSVRPKYELVFHEARAGKVTAMMLVNCPLTPGSEPLTAYGSYCTSERDAKHSAALAYLNKYLRDKACPPYTSSVIDRTRDRPEDRIYYEELEELEAICSENGVDPPLYLDVTSARCKIIQMECHVSDLVTKGSASNKVDARRMATKKMIEILSGMRSNSMNSESPEPPAQNHEISSSSVDPLENQPVLTPDERKSESTPNLLRSSKPLESLASGVAGCSISVDAGPRKLTQLQAASRSARTFKSLERELLNNILDVLERKNLPHQTTVKILYQEFLVIIEPDTPPVILEEHGECLDQSIRIACLCKLFQDLTENMTQRIN